MAYQPKEFEELVFTNTESGAKVDGDFLVFSSGARISLDQIKSVDFDISHSWRVQVGIFIGVISGALLLGMTTVAIKTFLGTSEKQHPPEVIFICLGIGALVCCFSFWFSSSGIKYFVVVKTNSGEPWTILKKNINDSKECFKHLNTQIFVKRRPSSLSGLALLEQLKKDRERLREYAGLTAEEFKLMRADALKDERLVKTSNKMNKVLDNRSGTSGLKMGIAILLFLAVVAGGTILHRGFNLGSLFLILYISVIVGVVFYFNSRTNQEPTKIEKMSATIYLYFRRFVCFSGAIFFLGVAIKLMFFSEVLFDQFGLSLAVLCMAGVLIRFGVYGRVDEYGRPEDDVKRHEQRKARYKWPW